MAQNLTAKASLITTDFGKGVQEIRDKLSSLNTSLEENKQALKAAAKEANSLLKEQQKLSEEMKKGGGTDEQKQKMQQLSDKIAQVNAKIGSLRAAEGELKSAVRVANKELEEQKTATSDVKNSLGDLGGVIKTVIATVATKTLYEWLFGSNAEMEQYLTSFTVMLGDAEKAKNLLDELTNFAATTPLEMTDVISASEMLMNYGVAADEVIEKMTQLGDLSSGNAAKLDRVTLAYGQMLAKGKVTNEELRQMIEAGVPLLQALADTMGITTAEVQDLASKSKIGIEELDAAIDSLTTDGGQFAGMMEQQSQTFEGMLSNAKDTIAQIGRDIGEDAFEELKTALSDILGKVQELEADGTLKRWAEEASEAVANLTSGFIDLTELVLDNKEAIIALVAAYATMKGVSAILNNVENAQKSLAATAGTMKVLNTDLKALPALLAPAGTAIAGIGTSLKAIIATGGVALAAIAAIIAEVKYISSLFTIDEKVKDLTDRVNELKSSIDVSLFSFDAKARVLEDEVKVYEELRAITDRTAEEEERLKALAGELQNELGDNCEVVNSLTGEYNDLTGAVEEYITTQTNKIRFEAIKERAEEAYKLIVELEGKMEERNEEHLKYMASNDFGFLKTGETYQFLNDMDELREAEREAKAIVKEYEDAVRESFEDVASDSDEMADAVSDNAKSSAESLGEIDEAVEECRKSTDELVKSTKTLSAAFDEQNENGGLSADTILSLVDAGYAAALAVDAETNAVKLDAEAYRELAQAKLDSQKADLLSERRGYENIYNPQIASTFSTGNYELGNRLVNELKEKTAPIDAQIMAIDSVDLDSVIAGSSKTKSSTSSTSTLPEEYASEKKTLKYKYDMGEIDGEKYYEEWYKLMQKHGISEDSDEWRSVDVEKKKYTDSQTKTTSKTTSKDADKVVSETETMMKTLSTAFSEQKENGTLSASTVEKLIDLGYEEALAIDEVTGAITLKTDKTKELFDEQVKTAQTALDNEEKELEANGKSTAGIKAKSTALKNLIKDYSNVEKGIYGASAAEKSLYSDMNKAFKEASDERIKQIDKELEAKKKAANEAIEAIEEEVEARKRAKEDDDIQSEIDSVSAQLKYAQLDDFSRAQLERKLSDLYDEQADIQWERSTQDRKDKINDNLDADEEAAKAEKEAIEDAATTVTNALNDVADGIELSAARISAAAAAMQTIFGNLSTGAAGNTPNITNNITTNGGETTNNNSFTIGTENYTVEQVIQIIYDALGNPTI